MTVINDVEVSIRKGNISDIKRAVESGRDVVHGLFHMDHPSLRTVLVDVHTEGYTQVRGTEWAEISPGRFPCRKIGRKYLDIKVDGEWMEVHADSVIAVRVGRSAAKHRPTGFDNMKNRSMTEEL